MADLNRVILAGRLTRDPDVRFTPSGTAVADLGVAISERFKTRSGEWEERAVFVDVVVWGRQAETSGEYLSKGSPVLIEGRLQLDQWETQQGDKRSRLRVRADRVQFLGQRSGGGRGEMADAPQDMMPKAQAGDSAPESADDDDIPF